MNYMNYLLLVLLTGMSLSAGAEEALVEIRSREGVSVKALVTYPAEARPEAVVILLAGGKGDYRFSAGAEGVGMINGARLPNRLRPLLLQRGFASWMVDSPSDMPEMLDGFRRSASHLADLRAVLADAARRYPGVPVVVVGHSNGTQSAALLAADAGESVAGVVLIAGRLVPHPILGEALSSFRWDEVKAPLLLMHHKHDDCFATPYSGAERLAEAHPRIQLLTIGADARPHGGCTYEGTHNLAGDENIVAGLLADWIRQQLP